MDFQKITLTPDGLLYIRWLSAGGNVWESWLEPMDAVSFIKALLKIGG